MTKLVHRGGNGSTPPRMTSVEIAELVDARHDNVRRTIERLADKGVIQLPPLEEIATGARAAHVYVFEGEQGKRDSYVVVAQLSPEFTARLVDRWQELEKRPAMVLRGPRIDLSREHRLTMKDQVMYARMAGLTGNQMLLAANRATKMLTGIDNLGLLGVQQMAAPQNEALLTPTEIGRRSGKGSAQAINRLLCRIGFQHQFRDAKGGLYYEPTEAGEEAGGTMQDTGKKHGDGTPVRQLKWPSSIIRRIQDEEGVQ